MTNCLFKIILFSGLAFLMLSCAGDAEEPIPDVSDIVADFELRRFEQDLFSMDTTNLKNDLETLVKKYPDFGEIYFNNILQLGSINQDMDRKAAFLQQFLNNYAVRKLIDTTNLLFQDFSPIKSEFQEAFRFFKYYFPERPTPDVTTFISEFGVGVFIYKDQSLAVGLDFFLGADFPYGSIDPINPNFSSYITRTFNRDHLVAKTLAVLVEDLVGQPKQRRLIDMMVNNGKKLYLMDHLMPYTPDSIKMEVTGPQMEWLEDNELEMWAFFLKDDLIYDSEWSKIAKYVDLSPSSPGMPPEAPGRTANWMGWQIVKAYMQGHPNKKMQELLQEKDAQVILNASRYRPKRR